MEQTYRLKKPLLLTFTFSADMLGLGDEGEGPSITREELITHVTLRPRIGEADEQERDACRALYDRIDMRWKEPFTADELLVFNITEGLREAYDAAAQRARDYCTVKGLELARAPAEPSPPIGYHDGVAGDPPPRIGAGGTYYGDEVAVDAPGFRPRTASVIGGGPFDVLAGER
ncbi:MAG TPA: hypothetical protein VGB08_11445 [Allosphingosinicella sp.]|jgi:hypothetical protein